MTHRLLPLAIGILALLPACDSVLDSNPPTGPTSVERTQFFGFLLQTGSPGMTYNGVPDPEPVNPVSPQPNGEYVVRRGGRYHYEIFHSLPRVSGRTVQTTVTSTWKTGTDRVRTWTSNSGAVGCGIDACAGNSGGIDFPQNSLGLENGVWRLVWEAVESGADLQESTRLRREWVFRPQ